MSTADIRRPETTAAGEALAMAATRLHRYLVERHWTGSKLTGPDPGIRFNARIFRFVKSYLEFVPWRDDLVYAQAQKYWISANRLMSDLGLADEEASRRIGVECARYLREAQRPEGYWEYPNPEWRGRIATVEGNYASIGMLLSFLRSGDESLLEGARRWYEYAVNRIGFQVRGDEYAINYFGNVPGGRVPNNSASAVHAFALLAKAAGDERYLEHCPAMIRFMARAQLPTGELPYAVEGVTGRDRIHFLCYQYNAFQLLNIDAYRQLTGDESVRPILEGLASYLAGGLTEEGAARYDCSSDQPEVVYYTAAIGRALSQAESEGLGGDRRLADRAFARVLSQQREDGSFPYSFRSYGYLDDRRSYPRYLAMILTHLLEETRLRQR